MKRLITILAASLALTSCQKFDDTAIRSKLNEQTSTLNSQESRIRTVEQQLARYNTDIASVKTVVEKIGAGIVVKQCLPFSLNGTTGYTLSFSDGTTATVYDGKDGANGGVPVVSFASVDGMLCWTIDGKLLKDADGKQIPVKGAKGASGSDGKNGADADPNAGAAIPGTPGKSPALRISGGNWEWSTDGTNWAVLGPATGVQGQTGNQGSAGSDGAGSVSFFKSIVPSTDGTKITMTLKDGTTYVVNVEKPSAYTISADGETLTFHIGKASFEMALVKAGTFIMGNGEQKEDIMMPGFPLLIINPAHKVTLTRDFWIMKENVDTTTAYELITSDEKQTHNYGLYNDSKKNETDYINFFGPKDGKTIEDPKYRRRWTYFDLIVERMTEKTGIPFDLPTEAQWEYAAKGGHKSKGYKYFGTNDLQVIKNATPEFSNELGIKGMKFGTELYSHYRGENKLNSSVMSNPVKDGADFGGYDNGYGSYYVKGGLFTPDATDPCPPVRREFGFVRRIANEDMSTEYRSRLSTGFGSELPAYSGSARLVVYAEDLN